MNAHVSSEVRRRQAYHHRRGDSQIARKARDRWNAGIYQAVCDSWVGFLWLIPAMGGIPGAVGLRRYLCGLRA